MTLGLGESIIYDEVEPASPAGEELQAHGSTYYSQGWKLTISSVYDEGSNDRKIIEIRCCPITPTFKDRFAMDISALVGMPYALDLIFFRDEAGDIAGFILSSGRAKNQKFLRSNA